MHGDPKIGAMLRKLRISRNLTLAAVARKAGCAESLLSYVERGQRQLQLWMAEVLDTIYGTGEAIVSLITHNACGEDQQAALASQAAQFDASNSDDVVIVQLSGGGSVMPIPRRELLAGLGIGAFGKEISRQLDSLIGHLNFRGYADSDSLALFEKTFAGFSAAARSLPPAWLIDGLIGQVALLDSLRRNTRASRQHAWAAMQARYAECLSWLCEEAGDLSSALYWIDRAAQWAGAARWEPMVGYTFVRRSMLVLNATGDGKRAVDAVAPVEAMSELSWVRGLAWKQAAMGYAQAGEADASARALEEAMALLAQPGREDEIHLGQRSVAGDDLYTLYQATCSIYLGRGASAINALQPRLDHLAQSSLRTATISRGKLARAFANAGQPGEAIRVAHETLDAHAEVNSHAAVCEIRRSVPALRRWERRPDVSGDLTELEHRLSL